ncbi:MAG: hypothetical protein ACFFAG_08525 [Promethearchaeota archaeon]
MKNKSLSRSSAVLVLSSPSHKNHTMWQKSYTLQIMKKNDEVPNFIIKYASKIFSLNMSNFKAFHVWICVTYGACDFPVCLCHWVCN